MAADTGAPDAAGNANEAFLVNGTLSSGLDAPGQQGPFDHFRGDAKLLTLVGLQQHTVPASVAHDVLE